MLPTTINQFEPFNAWKKSWIPKEATQSHFFLHDNAPSHMGKPVCSTLETFSWEVLPHVAYSPDLNPSDYHLCTSMGNALTEQCSISYEDIKKWLNEWFTAKGEKMGKMYNKQCSILWIKQFLSFYQI